MSEETEREAAWQARVLAESSYDGRSSDDFDAGWFAARRSPEAEVPREELADYIREEIWEGDFAEQDLEEADNLMAKYRIYRREDPNV